MPETTKGAHMGVYRLIKNTYAMVFYRLIAPFFDPLKLISAIRGYFFYIVDAFVYSRQPCAEPIKIENLHPQLHDKTKTTKFDAHYLYQDTWAFKKIKDSGVKSHIDVGSSINFVGFLSQITEVTFIDIRPLKTSLNLISKEGTITSLPYGDNTIESISSLHVAEHIGLGRYGDPIDALGTKKAANELSRVLSPGGKLYFSLPIGKPRLCYNAHRIHSPQQIFDYFPDLTLIEFSGIDDAGNFREDINPNQLKHAEYACGLFVFTKEGV